MSVVKDTELSGDIARMRMQEAIAEGAVAIVGPAASGEVSATYPTARDAMVPMMSPSSTLAALSKPDVNDGGFLFRNVPDDETQGVAAAYLPDRDPRSEGDVDRGGLRGHRLRARPARRRRAGDGRLPVARSPSRSRIRRC